MHSGQMPTVYIIFLGSFLALIILAIPVTVLEFLTRKSSDDNKGFSRKAKRKLTKLKEAAKRFSDGKDTDRAVRKGTDRSKSC